MNGKQHTSFTPGRIVSLALIALGLLGLAYIHSASGSHRLAVPSGAHAGQLTLHPCTYAGERADCGTLVVPENRHKAGTRLIALPVTRVRARAAHPGEPIFRLQGGPGLTNMDFTAAARLNGHHDVVLVGYRGVDGSSRLDCPEAVSALKHSADLLGDKSFRAYGDAFRSCATRLEGDGVDLAGYTIPERVDDLEAARRALGYSRIDLVSESAGTRYAMVYAWRYPHSINRSVMIGVNPPGHFPFDTRTTNVQFRRYARLCAADESCSKRTDDLVGTMRRTAADMPKRFWFLPIKPGNVRAATAFGLPYSTDATAPLTAPMTLGSWLAASHGDASGMWFLSTLAGMAFPQSFVWGEFASMGRIDNGAIRRYFAHPRTSIIGSPGAAFIFGGGREVDAWPASTDDLQYRHVRRSDVETLLVGGALDMATPPQNATRELLPYLAHGKEIVLPQLGHSDTFWAYEPQASTHLLETYFDTGRVDTSGYTPAHVDFTPSVTQTALGKGLAGTIIGLAALTVLSLLLMARRVRRRGRFGRKAGVALRTVYPLVLGLGGWFLGVLIVLVASPTTPLDDELLGVLGVGIPIGLGIYYAWVDRDWSPRSKAIGLVTALAGALAGALVGLHAATGMASLLTAILGTVLGANLAVLGRDIVRERSERPAAVPIPAA